MTAGPGTTRKPVPWQWKGVAVGFAIIIFWYAATRTTLVLAYKGGTLAQVQALCDSSLGRFGRAVSAQGAADCDHIDTTATWWNAAGFAGLLAVLGFGASLIYQSQQRRTSR